jgi:hypothetical protein
VSEVARRIRILAQLTFGEGEPPHSLIEPSAQLPTEGVAYSAEPVASPLEGTLVLAFSIRSHSASELYVRSTGDGLVGVFDGLDLVDPRGSLTRPGSVRFRPADSEDLGRR